MAADVRADERRQEVKIDTIFALSSGSPPAAIAVVRISGPRADLALEALAGTLPPAREARLVALRHEGEQLDSALALRFPGPRSATGEDVAELHLHGGRAVVAGVLGALSRIPGLRQAEPGEFTRRALENGRIDLTEAEGLADLLSAETQSQRRAALALAGGALGRQVEAWRRELLELAAMVEAALDFSDEGDVGEEELSAIWHQRLARLGSDLRRFLSQPPVERLRDGVRIVIAGPPNAGKSTLLNYLAGRDAAITSPQPGTTRDVVEAPVAIAGMPFLLIDTAGIRESDDPVEAIGVERAQDRVRDADIILWLGDPASPPDRIRSIVVEAKSDAGPATGLGDIAISAVTGAGMAELLTLIAARARALLPGECEVAINARHRAALSACLDSAVEALECGDLLVKAEALRQARVELDRVTGRSGVEDMLDALFAGFCIGK